ncbi:hypothetical protein J6590_031398 [Homalodisca vitripennis]|nr:hypothetical protein J6590_031398 [Homalodisca vitripennis]
MRGTFLVKAAIRRYGGDCAGATLTESGLGRPRPGRAGCSGIHLISSKGISMDDVLVASDSSNQNNTDEEHADDGLPLSTDCAAPSNWQQCDKTTHGGK